MKVTWQGSYYRLAVSTTAVLYTNDLYVAHQDISSLGDNIYLFKCATIIMQDRRYEKKKQAVEKFIRKYGKVDHSVILNEIDVDYDTLMKIISELRKQGHLK
jgi:hypothetical protein